MQKESRTASNVDWSDIELGACLGKGAFNAVYQVNLRNHEKVLASEDLSQLRLANQFALKRPYEEDTLSQAVADLETEVKILQALPHHPNIIRLYAVSSNLGKEMSGGLPFFVLERLDETLGAHLHRLRLRMVMEESILFALLPPLLKSMVSNRKKLDNEQCMRLKTICLPIAEALSFLHQHRVIYRDLKPGNVGFSPITGKVKLLTLVYLASCLRKPEV